MVELKAGHSFVERRVARPFATAEKAPKKAREKQRCGEQDRRGYADASQEICGDFFGGESGGGKSVSSLALMRLLPKPAARIVSTASCVAKS